MAGVWGGTIPCTGVVGMMDEGNVTWWMDHGWPPSAAMLRGMGLQEPYLIDVCVCK